MKKQNTSEVIPKEQVSHLQFPPQEVLTDALKREERARALHKATGLGNLERRKVRITFEDGEGLKEVYTTIWAVNQGRVVLKEGRMIPAHRVHSVRIE